MGSRASHGSHNGQRKAQQENQQAARERALNEPTPQRGASPKSSRMEEARAELAQLKKSAKAELDENVKAAQTVAKGAAEKLGAAVQDAGARAQETGRSLLRNVADNPMPLALTGIGMSWLIFDQLTGGRRRTSTEQPAEHPHDVKRIAHKASAGAARATESVKAAAGEVMGQAHKLSERTQSSIRELRQTTNEKTAALAQDAREQREKLEHAMEEQLQTHPLLVGAAAIIAGSALGYAVPLTRRERDLMGTTGQEVVARAKEMARTTFGKAEGVAQMAQGAAKAASSAMGGRS